VDSSVAALLLKKQGARVIGATLGLSGDLGAPMASRCCSPQTVARAKAVADHLGIPHYVVDATGDFLREVVEYFVDAYARGFTPNPCAKCNSRVRFYALRDAARRLGADRIATGHYARLDGGHNGLARGLARARDRTKDQSYVLAEVPPDLLENVVFPLGDLTKSEVRAMAAQVSLQTLVAQESQEICFIPDDDHRTFLRGHLGEVPGSIVASDGRVLGRHTGTYNYTVGQRRGLGCASGEPLYVLAIDAARNEVVVAPRLAGAVGTVVIDTPIVHRSLPPGPTHLQLRSLGGTVPALAAQDNTFLLLQPALGVALGQTAVLYANDEVITAGTIISTRPWFGPVSDCQEPKSAVV
jgi:tRNA-specific 2-thiouridylase